MSLDVIEVTGDPSDAIHPCIPVSVENAVSGHEVGVMQTVLSELVERRDHAEEVQVLSMPEPFELRMSTVHANEVVASGTSVGRRHFF